jgi:hypothetical protein
MKRLHDVAVRMRPRVPRRPDGAPRVSEEDGAATTEQTVPPTAGAGFSKPGDAPRIPARNAFMPSSRDLARRAAEAADDFPLDAPEADTPATAADGPPQDTTQSATVTDHTPGPDRPISRRQIWDLEPDELEDVASQSVDHRPHLSARRPRRCRGQTTPSQRARPSETGRRRRRTTWQAARCARCNRPNSSLRRAVSRPSALYEGDGAKTRVLGFHSPDLETDAISAVARKSVGDVRFPAGWIVVVEGPGRGAYFAVTNSVSSIGRGLDQSICLNFGDASISRNNHAAIAYDAEQNRFFLGHGNKSNIVRRNGQPVLSTEELMDGDEIRIGKTTLRFVALCGPKTSPGVRSGGG